MPVAVAVLLEVHPVLVVRRQRGVVIVGHRHSGVEDAFLKPAIPVAVDIIIWPSALECSASRSGGRRVPGNNRRRLFDVWLYCLDFGIHLSHKRSDLVSSPLLPLRISVSRRAGESVEIVVSGHVCGVVSFGLPSGPDIVIVNGINIKVGNDIHRHVGRIFRHKRMAGVHRLIINFRASVCA